MNIKKLLVLYIPAVILVFIDQFTKSLAFIHLKDKPAYPLINDVLELTYTTNDGAAFGILSGNHIIFLIITIFVLIYIVVIINKVDFIKHNVPYIICLILIFAGAFGNLIDRIRNKFVIDFIYFKPINFPVFNFADIYITTGALLFILCMFTIYKDDNKSRK